MHGSYVVLGVHFSELINLSLSVEWEWHSLALK